MSENETRFPEIRALADKARAMQAAHDACERNGGHYYNVDGFSLIAHPEAFWTGLPSVASLSDVVFRAYVCNRCGRRVSVEEGRNYQHHKYDGTARRKELMKLAGITPEMEPWYRTDG